MLSQITKSNTLFSWTSDIQHLEIDNQLPSLYNVIYLYAMAETKSKVMQHH